MRDAAPVRCAHRETAVDIMSAAVFLWRGGSFVEENKRIDERKAQLMDILLKDEPLSAEDEALCVCCSMDSPEGAELCAAFTDDELLELLRVTARRLDHSPAQGEVHWLLRQYLRSRFRNWPGTLRAAGLSRAAGRGGLSCEEAARKEQEVMQMLSRVREAAERLGRIPHPSELPEVCRTLHKRYQTWSQVLAAAGVEQAVADSLWKADDLKEEDRQRLGQLRAIAQKLNRAPLRSEIHKGAALLLCPLGGGKGMKERVPMPDFARRWTEHVEAKHLPADEGR